jgi:hypothetical protein
MRRCLSFAGGLLAAIPFVAPACRFAPETGSLAARLEQAPLAFVGTVTGLAEGRVFFHVEKTLAGSTGPVASLGAGTTACHLRFVIGQRWLFAGGLVTSPSRLLRDEFGRPGYRTDSPEAREVETLLGQAGLPVRDAPMAGVAPSCAPRGGSAFAFASDPDAPPFPAWRGGPVRGQVYARLEPFEGVRRYETRTGEPPNGARLAVRPPSEETYVPTEGSLTVVWEAGLPVLRIETAAWGVWILKARIDSRSPVRCG